MLRRRVASIQCASGQYRANAATCLQVCWLYLGFKLRFMVQNNAKHATMAPSRGSVAAGFVSGMLAGAIHAGRDARQLLQAVGIESACLVDGAVRVPLARYAALYEHINRVLDDEAFGLFSAPMQSGSFEFLCRCVLSAAHLEEALARAVRFLRLVLPDMTLTVCVAGGSALLEIRENKPLPVGRTFAYEWLLRLLHGLACWLVGRSLVLDSVDFPYPRPEHADDYALIYTASSRFEAPCLRARFSAHLLALPVRRDEAALARFLTGGPGRLTMLYRRDREFVTRVRDYLRATLPTLPELPQTAAAMGVSPRTLHRRLEAEGASYRAIRNALRRDLALNRLAKGRQPVAILAHELGFADPSAFYRAVRQWTGLSPSGYRRRYQRG